MKTIAVINQKGGVGKSTTAVALGAGLLQRGKKVLFVDLDPQGNLTYALKGDGSERNALKSLQEPENSTAQIQRAEDGDLIAATPFLAAADVTFTAIGKEYRLKEALENKEIQSAYDYCIIDTPPSLGIITVNALAACSGVIVPAQADIFSLQGIIQLNDTISTVRRYCNPDLKILGIVITRFNRRTVIRREVAEQMEETARTLQTKVYKSRIRECTAVLEAHASQESIFRYAPKSNAAADYAALVKEFLAG